MVQQCQICAKLTIPHKEPMIVSQPPDYPWQKVGSDLFELNGQKYMLLVDYFSRFLEVTKLSTTTSVAIIHVLKTTFSRYGIPEVLITDDGPQYISSEMKEFSNKYGFTHVTSSPRYPQGNGQAERAVQTAKRLLKCSDDPGISYNATPLPWCNLSPSELLMGRKLRATLPQTTIHLFPEWRFLKEFKRQNKAFKDKQETQYNRAHRTRPLPPLEGGMDVWVSSGDRKIPGQVVAPSHTPSSYLVGTPLGQLRRNRHHLIAIRNQSSDLDQDDGTRGTGSKDQPQPGSQEVHAQSTPLDESHTVTSNDNQED